MYYKAVWPWEWYQGHMNIDCGIISLTMAFKVISFPIHVYVLCISAIRKTCITCPVYAHWKKSINYSLLECIKQILRTQKHLAIFFIKEYKLERIFF